MARAGGDGDLVGRPSSMLHTDEGVARRLLGTTEAG
jgi:hypothetical protein